jgi:CO/xanthine dehydrogenase FAD-binding subunit
MKPPPFVYHDPSSIAEVVDLLQRYGGDAKVLAGGQSLMPLLNFRLSSPTALVDINRITALSYIRHEAGQLRIGALTRQRTIEFSPLVREHLPMLAAATTLVGHLPIRTRGTLGGSLAHADPAAEYPAVVTALEAELVVQGPQGQRTLRAEEFFVGYLTTTLAPDEVLVEVRFPTLPPTSGWAFDEFARRHGDFAIVGIAVLLDAQGEQCQRARLAVAGVGPTPLRLRAAEQILEQAGLTAQSIESAAARAAELVDPPSDLQASSEFRRHLTRVFTRRALGQAKARSQERQSWESKDRSASS